MPTTGMFVNCIRKQDFWLFFVSIWSLVSLSCECLGLAVSWLVWVLPIVVHCDSWFPTKLCRVSSRNPANASTGLATNTWCQYQYYKCQGYSSMSTLPFTPGTIRVPDWGSSRLTELHFLFVLNFYMFYIIVHEDNILLLYLSMPWAGRHMAQ